MNSSKSDLEIVYNLQWKDGSICEKSNIVGMYDIPATTLNWDSFKSYVLKNSGADSEYDIKVSYVSMNKKEFLIESQLDFQIAMYSFRQRARNGDIITLMLEKDIPLWQRRHERLIARQQREVFRRQQQEDFVASNSEDESLKFEKVSLKSEAVSIEPEQASSEPEKTSLEPEKASLEPEQAPEWFANYMKGLKKEIVDEVTSAMITQLSNLRGENVSHFPVNFKKASKLAMNNPFMIDKELTKALKLERKLDNKLEKLEQKSKKIKEKKLALVDYNENEGPFRSNLPAQHYSSFMGAVSLLDQSPLHMSGGENYQHQWNIMNTGRIMWTTDTKLCYAWGSEALKPMETIINLPLLEPGQKGSVTAIFKIPTKAGNYESYWHFYHCNERFGDWVGCSIIVDPSAVQATASFEGGLLKTVERDDYSDSIGVCPTAKAIDKIEMVIDCLQNLSTRDEISSVCVENNSMSDNQSIVSIADSNSTIHSTPSDEFVIITQTDCVEFGHKSNQEVKQEEKLVTHDNDEKLLANDSNYNIIESNSNVDRASEGTNSNNEEITYAYIHINGQKHAVPKYLLRDDYLASAEDAPDPLESNNSLENNATDAAESVTSMPLENTLSECPTDCTESIQNAKVQSIAASTECLANTSYKESIHSDVNDLSKENNLQDFEMDQSIIFGEPQMQDSTASFTTTNLRGSSLAENPCFEYQQTCPNHCLPLIAYRNRSILPPYKNENLTIDIPPSVSEGHNNLHDRFGFYMKHPHHIHPCKYCFQQQSVPLVQQPVNATGVMFVEPQIACSTAVNPHVVRSTAQAIRPIPLYRYEAPNEAVAAQIGDETAGLHILPNSLVSGAVNAASSALNTARSVLNMFGAPEQENQARSLNHAESIRDRNLTLLREMGFVNHNRNVNLLDHFEDDIERVVGALV